MPLLVTKPKVVARLVSCVLLGRIMHEMFQMPNLISCIFHISWCSMGGSRSDAFFRGAEAYVEVVRDEPVTHCMYLRVLTQ